MGHVNHRSGLLLLLYQNNFRLLFGVAERIQLLCTPNGLRNEQLSYTESIASREGCDCEVADFWKQAFCIYFFPPNNKGLVWECFLAAVLVTPLGNALCI